MFANQIKDKEVSVRIDLLCTRKDNAYEYTAFKTFSIALIVEDDRNGI